jgi:hypothetical protein
MYAAPGLLSKDKRRGVGKATDLILLLLLPLFLDDEGKGKAKGKG